MMLCSSSSRVTKKAAFSIQSRDFLLTPLLKYFVLAVAQGILGNFVEKNLNTVFTGSVIQKFQNISLICIIINSRLTCLQQSGLPVWPLLWREQMDHPGSSESGILFLWDTGVCPLGKHKAENSDPCGTPRYSRCPSNVEQCLCTHNKEGESNENTHLSG